MGSRFISDRRGLYAPYYSITGGEKMKPIMVRIGNYCRKFRINELELTLREVEGSENVKALSSFEHGRSSNIKHVLKYVRRCKDSEQQLQFLKGLINVMEGENNE